MALFLSLLWFIRTSKVFLFYFYLWQVKEYQVKRFLDHFRTAKGKRLIFNKINILKLFIFACFLLFQNETAQFLLIFLVFFLYLFESAKTVWDIIQKKIKIPVLTLKTILLIFAGFLAEIIILFITVKSPLNFAFLLLFFDLFSPFIASMIVLFFQPFAVLMRNKIIKKAIKKREQFKNLIAIGITGSYGKTSTKEFLATILSSKCNVLKTREHENSEIGISKRILNDLNEKHQVFIAEMGSYRKGGVKLLCDIVKPKIGVVTGINQQHLALFGSMENLISAEGGIELAKSLPEDGVLVLNGNNEIIKSKSKEQRAKISRRSRGLSMKSEQIKNQKLVSTKEKSDFWAENIKVEKEFISFKVFSKKGEKADFRVNLLGGYNVENVLMAAAVAEELGMTLKEISRACKNIKRNQGSMVLKKAKNGVNIIDSSYSANPDGVIADLEYLEIYKGRKVIVIPCLIELGHFSKEAHQKIGKKIGEVCDLAIITTKDRLSEIKRGAFDTNIKQKDILFIEEPRKIASKLNEYLKAGDTVLFEGRVNKKVIESLGD